MLSALSLLASSCSASPPSSSSEDLVLHAFKAVFGQTPHQVRIDARLDLAKRLLINDSMPVTDVCAAVGFASLGTFSHVFTRRIGSSPSAFRREAHTFVQVPGMLPLKFYPGCFTLMAYWPPSATFEKRAAAASVKLHLLVQHVIPESVHKPWA